MKEKWYVLQVIASREKKVNENVINKSLNLLRPFLPQKMIKIKKQNVIKDVVMPLYPGYLFIIGKWDLDEVKKILQLPYVIKFIGGINTPGSLRAEEIILIQKLAGGGLCNYSKAVKEGNKIRIVSGPLKELEGLIVSVDRRKQKVVVNLPLLNTNIKVTLGFEYIE